MGNTACVASETRLPPFGEKFKAGIQPPIYLEIAYGLRGGAALCGAGADGLAVGAELGAGAGPSTCLPARS